MAEFQTASAAIGLARDLTDLIQYLKMVKEAMKTVELDIEGLLSELESVNCVYKWLEQKYMLEHHDKIQTAEQLARVSGIRKALTDGRSTYNKFEEILRKVYGNNPKVQGRIDAFKKQKRLRSRIPKLNMLRMQIHTHNINLHTWLIIQVGSTNEEISRDLERHTSAEISKALDAIGGIQQRARGSEQTQFQHQVPEDGSIGLAGPSNTSAPSSEPRDRSLPLNEPASTSVQSNGVNPASTPMEDLYATLDRATPEQILASLKCDVNRPIGFNAFFDIPQPVDRNYVGRADMAQTLADCFFDGAQGIPQQQKRFVIYGVGGAGKTQFCCKFADDRCQRFWAVFWIDGRSIAQLKLTLIQNVAKVGRVDLNHHAALHWLANEERPWLLIVDSANDPTIDLMDYLPKGSKGHVLITTRNPGYQAIGNIGPRHFRFDGLNEEEAKTLFFSTAGMPNPSDEDMVWAAKIVNALGYLALAISVAGTSIRSGLCKVHEYIQYIEWSERREFQDHAFKKYDFAQQRQARVEATFEISYAAIKRQEESSQEARDALQLLKTLAFLHWADIPFQFFETCIQTAAKERQQEAVEREAAAKMQASATPKSWKDWGIDLPVQVLSTLYSIRPPDVLPHILRDGKQNQHLEAWRVRGAMSKLAQYSLITYDSKRDSWSMHPLVRKWAQNLFDSNSGEQYLHCEAAATLLSDCVYLQELDEELLSRLLPHVDAVREARANLERRIIDKRMSRMRVWPVFGDHITSRMQRALTMLKFSIVYMHNGRWMEAEQLQTSVQRLTVQVLGFKDAKTRKITGLLAETLIFQGRGDDSAVLLEQLLGACNEYCGPNNRETLLVTHKLGEARFIQGRISAAKHLYENALSGLQEICGPEHEDTLTVMDSLGKAMRLFGTGQALKKAKSLHEKTVQTRTYLHGPDDLRTVSSREFLYSLAIWNNTYEELCEADQGLGEIIEIRKTKLGKQHGSTLFSTLNQARVKVVLERFEAADRLFAECLPIVERNYGRDHMAVLFARVCLGSMRCRQKLWEEAVDILVDVTQRQKIVLSGWGRDHPDRAFGLLELVKAYDALGQLDERDDRAAEALRIFRKVTIEEHPWARTLRENCDRWRRQRSEV